MSGIGVRWVVVRFVIIAVALVALASCTGAGTPPASAPPISLLSHPAPNESGIAGFPRPPGLTVFAYGLDGERWSFNAEDRKTFDEVDRSVEALFPFGHNFGQYKWCAESLGAPLHAEQRIRRYARPGDAMVEIEVRRLDHRPPVGVTFARRRGGDCRTDHHTAP